jgi:hypothetical protein
MRLSQNSRGEFFPAAVNQTAVLEKEVERRKEESRETVGNPVRTEGLRCDFSIGETQA